MRQGTGNHGFGVNLTNYSGLCEVIRFSNKRCKIVSCFIFLLEDAHYGSTVAVPGKKSSVGTGGGMT